MPLVVPKGGERKMLELIINKSSPSQLVIRLYSNPVDFSDEGMEPSDFQEPSNASYSEVGLPASSWSVATEDGVSAATYTASVEFVFDGAADLYGYYVTDASGVVMWAEAFIASPVSIPPVGGTIKVRPRLQLN